ncbi:MAG: glycosyltransferase family 2 protein [Candidatus Micrarchaeota archaeon]|nr:glycosyltransferase family 2 protein [Candidatus Micrarchaeota archaeon]
MDIGSIALGIMLVMGYVLLFIGIFLMILAVFDIPIERNYRKNKHITPTFSLIAPSHNEEKVIERTIKIFLETIDYPMDKKEFLVINDGSTDKTAEIVMKYAGKIITAETGEVKIIPGKYKNVVLVNRAVGGKGKAFVNNDGIKYSTGEIVFIIDADIQVDRNAFRIAASHFSDKSVVAVSGYVYAKETNGLWNKFIISEYIMGQKILRRGFNFIGIHYVIPGGCAIMRRSTIQKVGDYSSDTLAEDTDFSWRIVIETKGKVNFDPSIKVIADEPSTIIDLWNQRVRWARGNLEVTWKHRHKVGRLRYGKATTHTYPFWITSQIMPIVFLMSTGAVVIVTITGSNLLSFTHVLALILGIVFYVSSFAVIGIAKGRYWLETLLTPGIPIVVSLTASMFLREGIVGLLNNVTGSNAGTTIGLILGVWFIIALPGTYFCLWLARKGHMKAANIIQLAVFGFWMFSIACTFEAYVKELSKSDRVWIRTVR